jgi:hypothetical protein
MCGTCRITQLTKGEKGEKGNSGFNAFKFVKEIESTGEGQVIIVTREEITACGVPQVGCLGFGTTSSLADLHIQLYLNTFPSWTNQPLGVDSTSCTTGKGVDAAIDSVTGDLYLTFNFIPSGGGGFVIPEIFRLVILA